MTMDIAKEHVEYISASLESHVVTYHTAARDLEIHVSKSKSVLSSYYLANKTRVTASFVATGTRKGNHVVRVFDDEADLTENCSDFFDTVKTVHVYCLSSTGHTFSPVDIAIEERKHQTDLSKLASCYSLGLLEGPGLRRAHPVVERAPASSAPLAKAQPTSTAPVPTTKPETTAKKDEKKEKPKLVYQSRKQQQQTPVISNYVSRKSEKSNTGGTAHKRPSSEKPSYEYKSRKVDMSQPRERVVASNLDHDEVEDEPMEPAPVKASVTESELNNMFLDDFTDDDEKDSGNQDMEVDQPIVVEHEKEQDEENHQGEDHMDVTQAPSLPTDDIWKSMSKTSQTQETLSAKASPAPETTVDDDGYFTSYKQNEAKPVPERREPSKEPSKLAKPSKKSDGKKKQTSVMNFFQKR